MSNVLTDFVDSSTYERQLRLPKQRMCGAAALVMAYRQCGLVVDQQTVWERVSHEFQEHRRAHTYHLAQDAIRRGLCALIVQTHQPWQLLQTCWRNNISTVINHRLQAASSEGHYSLLSGINSESVRLDDPWLGERVKISRQAFLELWLPEGEQCEIGGNTLVAIARREDQPSIYAHCDRLLDSNLTCQRCTYSIPLQPPAVLGCSHRYCEHRLWYRLFCPMCDMPCAELGRGSSYK